jgi:hypothetical protein
VEDFVWPGFPGWDIDRISRARRRVCRPFSPFSGEKVAEGRMRGRLQRAMSCFKADPPVGATHASPLPKDGKVCGAPRRRDEPPSPAPAGAPSPSRGGRGEAGAGACLPTGEGEASARPETVRQGFFAACLAVNAQYWCIYV